MIETQLQRRTALGRERGGAHPVAPLSQPAHRDQPALLTWARRPLRFGLIGGLCGLLQLGLLALLVGRGWPAVAANAVAFLLAAQVNFGLSSAFTWRDRRMRQPWWRRWLAFHAAIAAMALINQAVFVAAHTILPPLMAAALGIAVAALGNFLLGDRLVFRERTARSGTTAARQEWRRRTTSPAGRWGGRRGAVRGR